MIVGNVIHWKVNNHEVCIHSEHAVIGLSFVEDDILRLRFNKGEAFLEDEDKWIVERVPELKEFVAVKNSWGLQLSTGKLTVEVKFQPFQLNVKEIGGKDILHSTIPNMLEWDAHKSTMRFQMTPEEKIYGLGQDPMGNVNQRNCERRMWNEWGGLNRCANAGIPFYLSSEGYGLLLNSAWPARFAIGKAKVSEPPPPHSIERSKGPWPWYIDSGETNPEQLAIVLENERMDTFLICRDSADEILDGYTKLTGGIPMPPKWALGFIQSKNRYRNQEEFLRIAKEFRKRKIPCDVLVIDWLWFKEFGDMEWDRENWPDPKGMLKELAEMGFRVMQAQHPFIADNSIKLNTFKEKGYLMGTPKNTIEIFDHSNPEARAAWWQESKVRYEEGIRSFWIDMGEPRDHPMGTTSYLEPRERVHNLYSLLWAKGLYEGQRKDFSERVFLLSRTVTAGIQRYGATLWSNDIDSSWEVLKDQVPVGLGVSLSGMPYWCTDIGGFATDDRFSAELFVRWFQWGTFCPLFRTHGTRPDNEPWTYGEEAGKIIEHFISLRYRLMPYIYSCAWKTTEKGMPMMRPLCMDFPEDAIAVEQKYQYMFGPSLLVVPVVDPGVRTLEVYLPEGNWYNFWSGKKISGGRWITAAAPLEQIPLYVKEGSMIPMSGVMQYADESELTEVELHVYPGKAGPFELYEDDGVTYGYEKGRYAMTAFTMDEQGNVKVEGVKGDPTLIPEGRKYSVVKHEAVAGDDSEGLPFRIDFDTDLSCAGMNTLNITVDGYGKEIAVKAEIKLPKGWQLRKASNYLRKTPLPIVGKTSDQPVHLFWKMSPLADILPTVQEALIKLEITCGDEVHSLERTVAWGTGYATRWSTIGYFDSDSQNDRMVMEQIEKDPYSALYENASGTWMWHHEAKEEFYCQGYVDIRHLGHSGMKKGKGAAYARCKIWAPQDTEAFMEIGGERYVKVWLNGEAVYEEKGMILTNLSDKKVSFRKGWNHCLVKTEVNFEKQMSGREIGFNMRFLHADGQVVRDLLYMP